MADNLPAFICKEKNIRFIDDNNMEVPTLIFSGENKYETESKYPVLLINTRQKEEKEETVDLSQMPTIKNSSLNKKGLFVVGLRARGAWAKRKRVYTVYKIVHSYFVSRVGYAMKSIPIGHIVRHDLKNQRVRIEGKNAGPSGVGEWVYYQ